MCSPLSRQFCIPLSLSDAASGRQQQAASGPLIGSLPVRDEDNKNVSELDPWRSENALLCQQCLAFGIIVKGKTWHLQYMRGFISVWFMLVMSDSVRTCNTTETFLCTGYCPKVSHLLFYFKGRTYEKIKHTIVRNYVCVTFILARVVLSLLHEKWKILTLPRLELWPLGSPTRSQLLYMYNV
jgi:hypothetical protein